MKEQIIIDAPNHRYGVRPILFTDTGERAKIATIDGEPVALEPSEETVTAWARERAMVLVTQETLNDLTRRAKE